VKIGLDLDGVCYDWHTAIYTELGIESGKSFSEFWANPHDTLTEKEWEYIVSIPMYYEKLGLRESVSNVLPKLAELGELFYITSRDSSLRRVTERFLNKNKLPFKENLFMEKDKAYIARMLQLDYFVDDFVSQYDSVSKVTNTFLMAQPWNRKGWEGRNVIFGLDELYEEIMNGQSKSS